jgi:hypothetical protein
MATLPWKNPPLGLLAPPRLLASVADPPCLLAPVEDPPCLLALAVSPGATSTVGELMCLRLVDQKHGYD